MLCPMCKKTDLNIVNKRTDCLLYHWHVCFVTFHPTSNNYLHLFLNPEDFYLLWLVFLFLFLFFSFMAFLNIERVSCIATLLPHLAFESLEIFENLYYTDSMSDFLEKNVGPHSPPEIVSNNNNKPTPPKNHKSTIHQMM